MTLVTDWITAGAAIAATGVAGAALIWNVKATKANRSAAESSVAAAQSAQEQVRLMRPHPVVIAELSASIYGGTPTSTNIVLRNIGNEAAFDIQVAPIYLNEEHANELNPTRLTTSRVAYLLPGTNVDTSQFTEGRMDDGIIDLGSRGFWALVENDPFTVERVVRVRFRSVELDSILESIHKVVIEKRRIWFNFQECVRVA